MKHPGQKFLEEIFAFLREAERAGQLSLSGGKVIQAGALLHVLSMHVIIALRRIGRSREEILATVRKFSRLLSDRFPDGGREGTRPKAMKGECMNILRLLLLPFALAAFAAAAFGEEELLIDTDTAVNLALRSNLGLEADTLGLEVKRNAKDSAYNTYYPQLTASANFSRPNKAP